MSVIGSQQSPLAKRRIMQGEKTMSHQGTVLSPRPLARAIRVGLLTGSVAGIGLLAGCTDGGSGRFVDADKSTIGDPVKGELTSGSEINLKDGSRHGRHWMCGTAGDVGVLYQVKAPFLSQVSLYDDSGEWLGSARSALEGEAGLLLGADEGCVLVVVSGEDQNDYGPYALEPEKATVSDELSDGRTVAGSAGEESRHAFTVEEASQVALRLTGGGDATVTLGGEGLAARAQRCGDSQQTLTTYLEPGDYEAVISPGGRSKLPVDERCEDSFASTGNGYRLSLALSGLAKGERNGGPLRGGDQITGTLTGPSAVNEYTLDIGEPTQVNLLVSSLEFDAMLKLRGGDTNIEVDDTDGSTDPLLDTLLMPGSYRVQVAGFEDEHGAYSIDLATSPFDGEFRNGGVLPVGETLHGMADGSGVNVYTLTLEQASDVNIGVFSSAFDTMLSLAGPGVSVSDDDGAGDTNSRISTVVGPGEYRVEVSSYAGNASGAFRLEAAVTPYDGEISEGCEENQEGDCTLEPNTTIRGALNDGSQQYALSLEQSSQVVISMDSSAFDTLLALEGEGTNLSDDDGGGMTNSRISTLLEAGTYRITADTYDGVGPYTLRLQSTPVE